MQFISINRNDASHALALRLHQELYTKRVLLLLSGGSNVDVAVQVLSSLTAEQTTNLTVGLIDERFGPVGHNDSNWQALQDAGVDFKHASIIPVLQDGLDRSSTAESYAAKIHESLLHNDIVIGLLGMGEDGHTAGILPRSIAAQDTDKLVVDYSSDPFERITLSFAGLKKLNVAYLFAYGDNKTAQLNLLQDQEIDVQIQPVQIIKSIHEAYVYNEGKGDIE